MAKSKKSPTLDELQKRAGECSKSHGFWDEWKCADNEGLPDLAQATKLALIHSEVTEALEELRKGRAAHVTYRRTDGKPEGVPSELADIIIRVLDFAEYEGIRLEDIILEKMAYNEKRPYKHGKAF